MHLAFEPRGAQGLIPTSRSVLAALLLALLEGSLQDTPGKASSVEV